MRRLHITLRWYLTPENATLPPLLSPCPRLKPYNDNDKKNIPWDTWDDRYAKKKAVRPFRFVLGFGFCLFLWYTMLQASPLWSSGLVNVVPT